MKILCVSDTTNSLAFSPSVAEIYKGTDLILSCGDMPLDSHDYLTTMLRKDVYYVYGNHNLKDFRKNVLREKNNMSLPNEMTEKFYGFMLDGKCMRDKKSGLIIAGLGGSMFYNGGDSQYSETQMKRRIWKLGYKLMRNKRKYGRYLDILITHAPPAGIGDGEDPCHKGFKCFLDFMDRYQPKYLLHGHVHILDQNANRITEYNNTKVINISGSYLVDDDTLGDANGR